MLDRNLRVRLENTFAWLGVPVQVWDRSSTTPVDVTDL